MSKPYSAVARVQPSEHPRWCTVVEAHNREDCKRVDPEQARADRVREQLGRSLR